MEDYYPVNIYNWSHLDGVANWTSYEVDSLDESYTDAYYKYAIPVYYSLIVIVSIVVLILLRPPALVRRHHAAIYVLALIISNALLYLMQLLQYILGSLVKSDNHLGLPIFCNVFNFIGWSSNRAHSLIICLLLMDRLLQTLGHRRAFPASKFLMLAKKLCSHCSSAVSVSLAVAVGSISSSYFFILPHILNHGSCMLNYSNGVIAHIFYIIGGQINIFLYMLIIQFCLFYLVLLCVKPVAVPAQPTVEHKGLPVPNQQQPGRVAEDWKATKLALILAVLHECCNTHIIMVPVVQYSSLITYQAINILFKVLDAMMFLYSVTFPLLFLFYWPRRISNAFGTEGNRYEVV